MNSSIMKNKGEAIFAEILEDNKIDYIYQPKVYSFWVNYGYTPDFYIIAEQCYYEVVTTRQAYHKNKEKLLKIKNDPNIKFRIITPYGKPYRSNDSSVEITKEYEKKKLNLRVEIDLKDIMSRYGLSVIDVSKILNKTTTGVYLILKRKSIKYQDNKKIKDYIDSI